MFTTNYLTIDFEDWYQGLTSTSRDISKWPGYQKRLDIGAEWIINILEKENIKATFFILGKSAEDFPELIKKIKSCGHEISLHSYFHQRVDEMNMEEFKNDLEKNIDIVSRLTDELPSGYRAPCFSVNKNADWFWECLANCGLKYDSSIYPIKTTLYGNPFAKRTTYVKKTKYGDIQVFPISTIRLFGVNLPFSGGFYFRLLPYSIIKKLVSYKNRKGEPVVFYFHPWEFDPGQPVLSKTISRERISHYYGLDRAKTKFEKLIKEFSFGPLGK